MNFHLELRKSSCRTELRKRRTGRGACDILEVRAARADERREAPRWAPCRIRYYPGLWAASTSSGPAGQHIGWADNLADAIDQLAHADTSQVLPENGLLNERRPIK